jgi:dienelactone hydrolase
MGSGRRRGRWAAGALLVVGLLWAALALAPAARAWLTTALLLPDLLDLGGPRPLVLVSSAPTREEVRLDGASADLYRPAGGGRSPGLVLTLGVHPLDKRDPIVVRLGQSLARAGLAVLIVQSDDLVADRITPAEPGHLVAAFERLAADPGVEPRHVGLFGFSAGASLAFLAATDERIAERVRLVGWLGGYADALELTEQVVGRRYDGTAWQPHELTSYVFRKQLVDALPDPDERARLTAAYVADFGRGDPAARAALGPLGPDAARLVELFERGDPALVRALPTALTDRLVALSPIRAVDRFRARVYLMHDRSDPLVPYVQTLELAGALGPGRVAVVETFDIFEHVQPTRPLAPLAFAAEAWKLARTVAAILADLDPGAP